MTKSVNYWRSVIFALYLLALSVPLSSCGIIKEAGKSGPDILIKSGFTKTLPIAVVSFQKAGTSAGGADIGIYTADRLSEKMFLSDSFSVVERSRVNEAVRFFEVRNKTGLSLDDIQRIGLRLKASYLIVGEVRISGNDYLKEPNKRAVHLSMRIISVVNSDVIGAVSYSSGYEEDAKDKIDEMIKIIAERISRI